MKEGAGQREKQKEKQVSGNISVEKTKQMPGSYVRRMISPLPPPPPLQYEQVKKVHWYHSVLQSKTLLWSLIFVFLCLNPGACNNGNNGSELFSVHSPLIWIPVDSSKYTDKDYVALSFLLTLPKFL